MTHQAILYQRARRRLQLADMRLRIREATVRWLSRTEFFQPNINMEVRNEKNEKG
jgi:hypothetical protein